MKVFDLHFTERGRLWQEILTFTYALAQLDRIGNLGLRERGGVPGIWGHSYVRTYNDWAGVKPDAKLKMEGGIATSYYVLKALAHLAHVSESKLEPDMAEDVSRFFIARSNRDGSVGIQSVGLRGVAELNTNMRHTCFGFLTMAELAGHLRNPLLARDLEKCLVSSSQFIACPRSENAIISEWLEESWPVGGIAAYVSARDHIFGSSYGLSWERERRAWPVVRQRLLQTLTRLDTLQLDAVKHGGHRAFNSLQLIEHYPYWDPIKSLAILRLHSTLGCLSLVGEDIVRSPGGRQRIDDVVAQIRDQVLADPKGLPRFDSAAPPSIAAAFAMLEIALGRWYSPKESDSEWLDAVLGFIELSWKDEAVYQDYWTEFTCPLLANKTILATQSPARLIKCGEELATALSPSARPAQLEVSAIPDLDVLRIVTAKALGAS